MLSSATSAAAVLAIGLLLLAASHGLSRKTNKPRFVVALCLLALLMAAVELAEMLFLPADAYGHVWLGIELSGSFARIAGLLDVAIYMVGAVGLWGLKPWARIAAMVYLLYLLKSHLQRQPQKVAL